MCVEPAYALTLIPESLFLIPESLYNGILYVCGTGLRSPPNSGKLTTSRIAYNGILYVFGTGVLYLIALLLPPPPTI